MNKAFEKILIKLSNLRNYKNPYDSYYDNGMYRATEFSNSVRNETVERARKIVQEVAEEYNNGWIPCSERLPEEPFGCLVTVIDCEPVTQNEFENILPYFVGYDGHSWNDADGNEIPFDVIAWQPLPEPYKTEGE